MSDVILANEAAPATPASGNSTIYVDNANKLLAQMDDAGAIHGILARNFSTASQGAGFASDTYVTNSGLKIPSTGLQAGMTFRWWITLSKTAAGTAQAAIALRLGTAQTTADTAILTLTQAAAEAQTAQACSAILIITATLRNTGASGVLAGAFSFTQTYQATAGQLGFGGGADAASSTFDTTGKASTNFMGLSINGGASAAWTITSVEGQLIG